MIGILCNHADLSAPRSIDNRNHKLQRIVLKDDALRNIETLYMVIHSSAVSASSSSKSSTPRVGELVEKLYCQLSIQPSSENPASGREKFWKKMFGDEPMSTGVKDAAIKNAGSLGDDLDTVTDDDIADVSFV